jgi:flagellar hook-basal body complex protein FliE
MNDLMIGLNPKMQLPEIPRAKSQPDASGGANFGAILRDAISTTNQLQKQSSQEIEKIMTGESQDLHATMIAVQKADVSFQMMMQVRNKLVQAYQEIMRTQV